MPITEPQPATSQTLVLRGATIIDTRDGRKGGPVAISIENGKIAQIVASAAFKADAAATQVDVTGRFVVPGYLDMHAHPLQSRDPEGSFAMMLSWGITGVRQMAGSMELLAARRDGSLLPWDASPELLGMPGTILTPLVAGTPETAVSEVQRQKAAGADFIKVVELGPAAFYAALAESARLGLPFVGHIPSSVSVREAAKAGMRAVEHLFGSLEACSTAEESLLEPPAQSVERSAVGRGAPDAAAMERAIANPVLTRPAGFAREARIVETYSDNKCRSLAQDFAAAGTWQVPSLVRLRTMELGDDPHYRNDPNLRYVPFATRQLWQSLADQFAARITPAQRTMLERMVSLQMGLLTVFRDAGVKLLAGSDTGGGWCIPGASLHQEFVLLEEAGLTPLEILQMTTLNGARFFGRDDIGFIAAGKTADLVILDADPLATARNLGRISGVVRAGAYYSAAALEQLRERTAERYLGPTRLPAEF